MGPFHPGGGRQLPGKPGSAANLSLLLPGLPSPGNWGKEGADGYVELPATAPAGLEYFNPGEPAGWSEFFVGTATCVRLCSAGRGSRPALRVVLDMLLCLPDPSHTTSHFFLTHLPASPTSARSRRLPD